MPGLFKVQWPLFVIEYRWIHGDLGQDFSQTSHESLLGKPRSKLGTASKRLEKSLLLAGSDLWAGSLVELSSVPRKLAGAVSLALCTQRSG